MRINVLDGPALLAIPMNQPHRVFSGDDAKDQTLYRTLTKLWHPDSVSTTFVVSNKLEVFQHVTALYRARNEKLAAGTWEGAGSISFTLKAGGTFKVNYLKARAFELGTLYIGQNTLIYHVDAAHYALFQKGVTAMGNFRFGAKKMEEEMKRFLPVLERTMATETGWLAVITKTPDVLSLRDLVDHAGGALPAKHTGWILSSLHNLACYLEWAQIAHGAIDLDTYFVSPQYHSGLLLGGWWYADKIGTPLTVLPARSANLWRSGISNTLQKLKQANCLFNLAQIRLLGREVLGDVGGTKLLHDPDIPRALAMWVTTNANHSAQDDYRAWEKARTAAFPVRKFVEWDVSAQDLYSHAAGA